MYLRIRFPSAKETYYGLRPLEYRACLAFQQGTTFCTLCLGTETTGVSVPPPLSPGRPRTSITSLLTVTRLSPPHVGGLGGNPSRRRQKDNGFL
jgi:hypothetical protein